MTYLIIYEDEESFIEFHEYVNAENPKKAIERFVNDPWHHKKYIINGVYTAVNQEEWL